MSLAKYAEEVFKGEFCCAVVRGWTRWRFFVSERGIAVESTTRRQEYVAVLRKALRTI